MGNLTRSSLLAFCLAAASSTPTLADSDATKAEPASCYTYFGEICFPSFDIRSQTMTYPIDFSIDEIDLAGGAHVTIYEGIGLDEQNDVTNIAKAAEFDNAIAHAEVITGRSKRGAYFDVHYTPKDKEHWGVVQVFGYIRTIDEAKSISSFIGQFQQCTRQRLSLNCSEEWPFKKAADFLAGITPEASAKSKL